MAVAWPAFLQDKLNEAGFGLTLQDNILRSNNETGAPKTRARTTKRVDVYTCTITIEIIDYEDFDDFYTASLNNGVSSFEFIHPFSGILKEFKFAGPPKISPMGGTFLSVEMGWIQLP